MQTGQIAVRHQALWRLYDTVDGYSQGCKSALQLRESAAVERTAREEDGSRKHLKAEPVDSSQIELLSTTADAVFCAPRHAHPSVCYEHHGTNLPISVPTGCSRDVNDVIFKNSRWTCLRFQNRAPPHRFCHKTFLRATSEDRTIVADAEIVRRPLW